MQPWYHYLNAWVLLLFISILSFCVVYFPARKKIQAARWADQIRETEIRARLQDPAFSANIFKQRVQRDFSLLQKF